MGAGLCKDCFGLGGGSPEPVLPRRTHGSGNMVQADRVRDYRSTQNSTDRYSSGAQRSSASGPSHDEVRAHAAAAAEARLKSDQSRGLKNPSEFQRLQERQAKIEKAEEEAARKGQFDNRGGLKWQMN